MTIKSIVKVVQKVLGYFIYFAVGLTIIRWTSIYLGVIWEPLTMIFWWCLVVWGGLEIFKDIRKFLRHLSMWRKLQVDERKELSTGEVLLPGGFIEIPVQNGRSVVSLSELSKRSIKRIIKLNNL